MVYIYDCEIFPSFFCVTFKNVNTEESHYFEISDWQYDWLKLIFFIDDNKKWFIGYNNHYYDNQILNYIVTKTRFSSDPSPISTKELYELSNDIIHNESRQYKYNLPFRSFDLMRVGNTYQKSLKLLGCNLQHPKLQDLPLPYDHIVQESERELIKLYNANDIDITFKLYKILLPQIKLRKEITQMYNVNVMDESDSGIANKLLEKEYSELTGLRFDQFKDLRTSRDFIHFGDVIFKDIRFQTPNLKQFLDKLRNFVLIKDKTFFKKSIIVEGLKLDYGIGGLHGQNKPLLYKEDDEYYIYDIDVASLYPNCIKIHNIWPAHLDKRMLKIYSAWISERIADKHAGKITDSESKKLKLNSSFGKMLFEHHWLYDPLCGYQITINCQLYMTMLAETLLLDKFDIFAVNTDGLSIRVKKTRLNEFLKICKDWEEYTQFELEYVRYKIYASRDINNYTSITDKGKIKQKGDFLVDTPLQKGVDKKIIAIALQEYFIHNKSIKDTIMNHTNIYDFCTAQKTDAKFITEYHYLKDSKYQIDVMQKTNRFYISKFGGTLFKKDKLENKYINFCVGRQVTIFNDYIDKHMKDYNIDYGYYISETQKIINLIIPKQLTLF